MESSDGKLRVLDWGLWFGEIFKRLDIKTLGRSRCVCKDWNSMISSTSFICSHHSFKASYSAKPAANRQPYLLVDRGRGSYVLYHPQEFHLHVRNLSFPFRLQDIATPSTMKLELVDVIHGVVCLSYTKSSPFDSTLLWNPVIRRYIALPLLPVQDKRAPLIIKLDWGTYTVDSRFQPNAIGFGYQSSENDFKVVRVSIPRSSSSVSSLHTKQHLMFEVYSSRQALWREVEATTKIFTGLGTYGFPNPTNSCFLNGTVHWLLSSSQNVNAFVQDDEDDIDPDATFCMLLLMFDCELETFKVMVLPPELNLSMVTIFREEGSTRQMRLIKYSGMLSILLYAARRVFHLWAMEEYGVVTSWNKLFNIAIDNLYGGHILNSIVMLRGDGDAFKPNSLDQRTSHDPSTAISEAGFYQPFMNSYVYDERLFLLGAQSYSKEEPVVIQISPQTSMDFWRCPPVNWIKLNIHGVLKSDMLEAGVGGIFRDDQGRFVQAFAFKTTPLLTSRLSAEEVQEHCLWTGLKLWKRLGTQSLIIEMDLQTILSPEEFLSIRSRNTQMEREFFERDRVALSHVPAHVNLVAQWFAQTGMEQDPVAPLLVFDQLPPQVEQLIANDLCQTITSQADS